MHIHLTSYMAGTFLDRASRWLLSPEVSARFQTFKLGIFHQQNSRIAVSSEDDTSILTPLPNPESIPSAPAALCRQLREGTSSRKDYGLDLYRPAHSSYPLPKLNPLFKLLKSTEGWLRGTIHTALCNVHALIDGNRHCLSPFCVALL